MFTIRDLFIFYIFCYVAMWIIENFINFLTLVFNILYANYDIVINFFGCIIVIGMVICIIVIGIVIGRLIGIKEIIFKGRVPGAKRKNKDIMRVDIDKKKGENEDTPDEKKG